MDHKGVKEPKNKGDSKVLRELRCQQEDLDEKIQSLHESDDEKSREIGNVFVQTRKKIRYRILSIKRKNGGLTEDEEQELQALGG